MVLTQTKQPLPSADRRTAGSLEIREAGEGDLELIRDLHVAVGLDERSLSYDRWRFFSGPYGISPSVLAMDGGRAAGFYTVWPVKVRLGNETVMAAQSMDTMTHPDYRGRGVFVQLAQACYDLAASRGFEVLYGFPNQNSYPGFIRRLNWDHTGDIPHWVRPLRPSGLKAVHRAIAPFADAIAALLPRGSVGDAEISFAKPEDTALQELLDGWCNEKDVCRIDRAPAWLDWRYAQEAEKDYEWVCAYRRGTLVAAAIWGMQNTSWGSFADGRARIGELFGTRQQDLQAVLSVIIARAKSRSAGVVEMMCNIETSVAALKRVGFFRHRDAPFIARGLTGRTLGGNIHNHSAWRITGGDWDGS